MDGAHGHRWIDQDDAVAPQFYAPVKRMREKGEKIAIEAHLEVKKAKSLSVSI